MKLSKIPRQYVYLVLSLAVLIPLLLPFDTRIKRIDKPSHDLFNAIDRIPPGSQAVLLSFDYDPSTSPELDPMAAAILRHCFARKVPVIAMSLYLTGAALGERAVKKIADEYGCKSGVDYCNFGYRPAGSVVILWIGQSARKAFPRDMYGTPFDSLPMMRNIRNYDDIPAVITLCGSAVVGTWIIYANARYHANIGCGTTAVGAPDQYQFLQTGQMIGQLGGMKGAAEYEQLIRDYGYTKVKGMATPAMNSVTIAHLLLIILVVLGNIGYFAVKRAKQKTS
ncbi:MAG: hypothetical protein QME74_07305 [Candidatus Edwardsbacteria bacterium]|nr:hypothetical protein [Candidatus Edwardsbacteria bacterium]